MKQTEVLLQPNPSKKLFTFCLPYWLILLKGPAGRCFKFKKKKVLVAIGKQNFFISDFEGQWLFFVCAFGEEGDKTSSCAL